MKIQDISKEKKKSLSSVINNLVKIALSKKTLLIAIATAVLALPIQAARNRQSYDDVYVEGYQRRDGTYVQPHYRSKPNAHQWDNYGYEPSKPQYNTPRLNSSPSWNMPNPGRMMDSNPYNNVPGFGYDLNSN